MAQDNLNGKNEQIRTQLPKSSKEITPSLPKPSTMPTTNRDGKQVTPRN